MAAPPSTYKDREFLGVIGDEVPFPPLPRPARPLQSHSPANSPPAPQDTVTGMLLAGIGVRIGHAHLAGSGSH